MSDSRPHATRTNHRVRWAVFAVVLFFLAFLTHRLFQTVVLVHTAMVERQPLVSSISTNGNVEPQQDFEAHSPTAGTVQAVYVHEGDRVPAGKLLLSMDDSAARAQVAEAQAALSTAQAQLDAVQQGGTREQQLQLAGELSKARAAEAQADASLKALTKLQQQGAASPSEVDAAKGQLGMAQSSLHNLELQQTHRYAPEDRERVAKALASAQASYQAALDTLRQENVIAPFAGTVYSIPVRASEYVQAGDTLLKLADLDHIQVRAYFDEPEVGRLAVGQTVIIEWDARPNMLWHGHIVRVPSTIITYGTRHVGEAIVSVDDANGLLLPNTNVTLTVTTLRKDSVLTVPREALHPEGGQNYVFQVVNGQLKKTPIQIGAVNLTMVEVLSGLDTHAVVALSAVSGVTLQDGMTVHSVP